MNVHPPLGINLGMMSHALLGGGSIPSWVVNPTNPPDLAVDFSNNRAWTKATKAQTTSASLLTVSRASSGMVNDSLGNWTQVASNLPRLSDLGLLVEEARTNSIRNNSMAGAVVMADGVELLTNGNFASQGSGWTVNTPSGSAVFSTGQVLITGDNTTNTNYIAQQISGLTPGRSYVVKITGLNGFNVLVGTSAGDNSIIGPIGIAGNGIASNQSDRTAFSAPQSGIVWVSIVRFQNSAGTLTSVSFQDGERVQNGGFTSNPLNAAQSTVQNGWQWSNSTGTGTVALSGNTVQITGDGTNAAKISAAIPTVAGFTYTISVDASVATGNVSAGTAAFGSQLLGLTSVAIGAGQKFQFTATTTSSFITFSKISAQVFTIANVSVQSAGALPTNWTFGSAGFFLQVVNVGVVSGVNVVDLRIFGTNTGQFPAINIDGFGAASSTYGQTWTASTFDARIAAVDVANVSSQIVQVTNQSGAFRFTSYNANLTSSLVRGNGSQTLTTAADTGIAMKYAITMTGASGLTMDQTIRIGWPQLENNSLVNSTVASAVTAASGASGVNGSAVYSVGGGTGTAATLNVTWAAGVMTVNSVASAGNYTVFPPSPAALTYVSGTATGWTGATVTLTPTDNSAKAFVTSPIVTTSAAATRALDNVSLSSPPTFGSAYTLFAQATPQAVNGNNQFLISANDGSSANRLGIFRAGPAGGAALVNTVGGVGASTSGTNWAQNASGKYAATTQDSDQAGSFNGGTIVTLSGALPIGVNSVSIGSQASTSLWNGFVSQAAIWASQRVPNAQLQSMTQ